MSSFLRTRWAVISALPFLAIGAGLVLLLVDPLLALVVGGLGLFVLTPLLTLVFSFWPAENADETDETSESSATVGTGLESAVGDSDDQLDALRERYKRGELDEAEFEQRVEGVLTDGDDADGPAGETPAELDTEESA